MLSPRSHVLLRVACLAWLPACGRYGFDSAVHQVPDSSFDTMVAKGSKPPHEQPPEDDAGTVGRDGSTSNPDAALVDASLGSDPPPARFDCAGQQGVLMCSTFDDPSFGEWTVPREFNGKSVASEGALIASTGLTGGVAAVYRTLPSFQGRDLYLRATVKLPAGYDLTHVDLLMLGASADNKDACLTVSVLADGMLALSLGNELLSRNSTFAVPRDRWFCLAAHIVLDPNNGSVQVEVDGTERMKIQGLDTSSTQAMRTVGVGIHWSSLLQAPAIVLADDFVLSTAPTSCN